MPPISSVRQLRLGGRSRLARAVEGLPDRHPLMRLLSAARTRKDHLLWRVSGKPLPLPPTAKHALVRAYGERFGLRVLVETGTYRGDLVSAVRGSFDRVYTLELDDALHARAAARFASAPGVTVLHGDSAEVLPALLEGLGEPCLFWLDAHWSGEGTASGQAGTPVRTELEAILRHPVPGHVVLVDDLRCFTGAGGYPTAQEVAELVAAHRPGYSVATQDDIVRIHPSQDRYGHP